MKIAKFGSRFFQILGITLMAVTVAVCLLAKNADPIMEDMDQLEARAEAMLDAACRGDLTAAQEVLDGDPDLGAEGVPDDARSQTIWQAVVSSLSYTFTGEVRMEGSSPVQDVTIRSLDAQAVTQAMQTNFVTLIQQRIDQAEEMSEIYDDSGEIRAELVTELVDQALEQAIEEAGTVSYELTLTYVYRDGRWYISPDQGLLQAISGGLAG